MTTKGHIPGKGVKAQTMAYLQSLDARTNQHVHAERMKVIQQGVASVELPPKWVKAFWDSSAAVHNPKRTVVIKVSVDKAVYVDKKLKDGEISSIRMPFDSCEEAMRQAQTCLDRCVNRTCGGRCGLRCLIH